MQKIYYSIVCVFLFLSCEKERTPDVNQESQVSIRLASSNGFLTRIVDEDNLAVEQIINNISLFFTDPASAIITHKYIYTGFSLSGDYQLITLPLVPSDLLTKDIYVIANFNNEETLNNITTLDDLQDLHAPEVNKSDNLSPGKGFCMFGQLADFDFTTGATATIGMERCCAKYRINLVFPEDEIESTANSFLIQNAAMYTYVVEAPSKILPLTDYFTFAAPISLIDNGTGTYTNNTYIYEASVRPQMIIYTQFNGSQQEFSASLPIPVRNYLYDINVEIYEYVSRASAVDPDYLFISNVEVYNGKGEFVEKYTITSAD